MKDFFKKHGNFIGYIVCVIFIFGLIFVVPILRATKKTTDDGWVVSHYTKSSNGHMFAVEVCEELGWTRMTHLPASPVMPGCELCWREKTAHPAKVRFVRENEDGTCVFEVVFMDDGSLLSDSALKVLNDIPQGTSIKIEGKIK